MLSSRAAAYKITRKNRLMACLRPEIVLALAGPWRRPAAAPALTFRAAKPDHA